MLSFDKVFVLPTLYFTRKAAAPSSSTTPSDLNLSVAGVALRLGQHKGAESFLKNLFSFFLNSPRYVVSFGDRAPSFKAAPSASPLGMASSVEHSSLEIRLKRVDRIYRPGEAVGGVVVVSAKDGWAHKGILMKVSQTGGVLKNKENDGKSRRPPSSKYRE